MKKLSLRKNFPEFNLNSIYSTKIACERKNAIACASAVARTFPLYSAKTSKNNTTKERDGVVSFIYTDEQSTQLEPSQEEIKCFNVLAKSIRLTAKIVDTPCAEMTTDHFLEVVFIL
jgi:probable aminopeptidase NPEPL1